MIVAETMITSFCFLKKQNAGCKYLVLFSKLKKETEDNA